jgi:hypothetical protein
MKKTIKQCVAELQETGLNATQIYEKLQIDGIHTTPKSVKWYFDKNARLKKMRQ